MRLITHNLLKCNVKGLDSSQGYPLKVECESQEEVSVEFNEALVKNVLSKINFQALRSAAKDLAIGDLIHTREDFSLEAVEGDAALLAELHHLLFEVHVLEGSLVCPATGRRFPVKDGIPNMLLHEDEV
eukprot:gene7594-8394_t